MKKLSESLDSSLSKDLEKHGQYYSEDDLWKKFKSLPGSVVGEVMEKALLLRELLFDSATPLWIRGSIVGCLGYLIMPIDLIPDFLPGGFVDDLAAMGVILASLDSLVTEDIRQRARRRMPACFQPDEE